MKRNHKVLLTIVLACLLMLGIGAGVFAYYYKNTKADASLSTDIAAEEVIEIASFSDLFINSTSNVKNDSSKVSSSRKILRLTADVTLDIDLVITRDVHIDLNGKTLNLADHTLTINHAYSGVFSVYGGTIQLGGNNAKIIVDLLKAGYVTDSITYLNNTTEVSEESVTTVLSINEKYTAYNALYYIGRVISSSLYSAPERDDYESITLAAYNVNAVGRYISGINCTYGSKTEYCSFVYKDLDLPQNYLSTDINISYTSTKPTVLSKNGNVTIPTTKEDVTLTATISSDSWEDSYSVSFPIHVVNLDNSTVKKTIAEMVILDYISSYKVDEPKQVTEDLIIPAGYYDFNHAMDLPLSIFDGKITYSYKTYDYEKKVEIPTTSYESGNLYVFEPNDQCYKFEITCNGDTTNAIVKNMYSTYIGSQETVARLILNKIYGGSIVYQANTDFYQLLSLDDLKSHSDQSIVDYVNNYNITALSYTLIDNHDDDKGVDNAVEFYEYDSSLNHLTVANGKVIDDRMKASALRVSFVYTDEEGNNTTTNIDLNIEYIVGNEDNVSGFLPYYSIFKTYVKSDVASFDMPFCFDGGAPYVVYDFAQTYTEKELKHSTTNEVLFKYYDYELGAPESLKLSLYYDGKIQTSFKYEDDSSLTEQFDAWLLLKSGVTLQDLAKKTDIKWIVQVDVQNASTKDVQLLLIYNYKFKGSKYWTTYKFPYAVEEDAANIGDYLTESTSSIFTHVGGLFYNATSDALNCVQDQAFFRWIYNNFNPTNDSLTDSDDITTLVIPKNWLAQNKAMDVTTDSLLSSVTNFHGLNNLTNITNVNLSGKNMSTLITSITSMSSVTNLTLSNCSLTTVEALKTLKNVKVLDISNNNISSFDGLSQIKSLEKVYVYGNAGSSAYVGSTGICNYQAYIDLMRNGATVYHQVSEGVPVPYADSNDPNDFMKLRSIIFQDKLAAGKDISELWAGYSTTYSDYNLSTNGTLVFSADGQDVTEATYFVCTYTTSSFTLKVKYYVDRYAE